MAVPSWPSELPTDWLIAGYDEQMPDVLIRTQMEAGIPKVRRRYTTAVSPLSLSQVMTADEIATLEAFYIATLGRGAKRFSMTHPRTGESVELRFVSPPRWQPTEARIEDSGSPSAYTDNLWLVQAALEILP